jgi:hypothetical protein
MGNSQEGGELHSNLQYLQVVRIEIFEWSKVRVFTKGCQPKRLAVNQDKEKKTTTMPSFSFNPISNLKELL